VGLFAQRNVHCCVRSTCGSENRRNIRRRSFGSSNKSLIVCIPGWLARQPGVSPYVNADSIGYLGSSEETSPRAVSSRFNHSSDVSLGSDSVTLIICLRMLRISRKALLTGERTSSSSSVLPAAQSCLGCSLFQLI